MATIDDGFKEDDWLEMRKQADKLRKMFDANATWYELKRQTKVLAEAIKRTETDG
jgi:hypothetical protein